jgi:spore germination cell wall hydrolase CwlJ-like protein
LSELTRTRASALAGAVACGVALGVTIGGSQLTAHEQQARFAHAAAEGFSEQALRREAAKMAPGALAVARRHDPFIAPGAARSDRMTTVLVSRLERSTLRGAQAPVRQVTPAAPLRMSDDNPMQAARALDCLSQAVYYEARGESRTGQAAVAQVVLNRVRSRLYPNSVCGVVYQGAQTRVCQFSFACDGSMNRRLNATAWRRSRAVAARALGGSVMAQVGNATHFHVVGMGQIWGARLQRVAQIGDHVFYAFSGRRRNLNSGPEVYTPASEVADAPVYAQQAADASASDRANEPSMILASAVTATPLGEGGSLAKPAEPASAPAATAAAEHRNAGEAKTGGAKPALGAKAGAAPKVAAEAKADHATPAKPAQVAATAPEPSAKYTPVTATRVAAAIDDGTAS